MKINLIALKDLADRIVYQPEDGFINISSMLESFSRVNEFLSIDEIEERVYSWIEEDCSWGDGSWTSHGSWIWHSWLNVKAKLEGMGF